MITRQFVSELTTNHQTLEPNIAREYCQHLFLSYLYKRTEAGKMLFKGGTALRIVFASPRFSEDLDFSASELSVPEINTLIDSVLGDINKEGIQTRREVNPDTEGETSGGYFATINFKLLEFDSEIKIQASFRNSESLENNTTLIENDFIPPYTIVYLGEKLLVGEKVQALVDRAKPRDFFDLYFILRHRELVKFLPRDIENLKQKLTDKINEIIESGWESELKVFLPVNYYPLLKEFKTRLLQEIENHF